MSIAIAVVLQPSKIVRFCVVLFAMLLVVIGIYMGFSENLSYLSRCILVIICGLTATLGFAYDQKIAKTSWRISIDSQGQLRCQSCHFAPLSARTEKLHSSSESHLFHLVTGTTLWAHALFLRLHDQENGVMIHLVVLPDALGKDEFRRLSVACKWIVAHAEAAY